MTEAMSDLEKYINADDDLDVLIRVGLIHYQFETIHPFLDGNGRVGRLLITLFLMEKNVLTTPALYISYFLKKNRIDYYDRMTLVRSKGDFEQWVKFFLEAIYESALDATETIGKLASLHEICAEKIAGFGRASGNAGKLFAYIEANPIIEIQKTAKALGMAYNTAASAVQRLCDSQILEEVSGNKRNRLFSYRSYLDILREGT
jgi:Fic family protein